MFDVTTRSRQGVPNPVDHHQEGSAPRDAGGPEPMIQSLSPYSLHPTPYSLSEAHGVTTDEGHHHGRRAGYAPQAPDQRPAQADDSHRQRPLHGAHREAPRAPRLHGYRRHLAVHAGRDKGLLRRRLGLEREHPLLRRGRASRDGRLRKDGRAATRPRGRAPAHHKRRRPYGRRPEYSGRVSRGERLRGHHGPQERREPPGFRHRHNRGGRAHLPFSGEAGLGAGLLRHRKHRHLSARALGDRRDPRRGRVRLLQSACRLGASLAS